MVNYISEHRSREQNNLKIKRSSQYIRILVDFHFDLKKNIYIIYYVYINIYTQRNAAVYYVYKIISCCFVFTYEILLLLFVIFYITSHLDSYNMRSHFTYFFFLLLILFITAIMFYCYIYNVV